MKYRPATDLDETVDALLLPLLLKELEEDDVEERARGQALWSRFLIN